MPLVQTALEWIQGPALLPDHFKGYQGPECVNAGDCLDPARVIIASFVFHFLQFVFFWYGCNTFARYRKMSTDDKLMLVSLLVSTTHAIITAAGSLVAVHLADIPMETSYFVQSPSIDFFGAFCAGYFLYDFLLIHVFHKTFWSWPMFVHHFIGAFVFPSSFVFGAGSYFVVFFLLMEASTPFVNLRWIISAFGHKTSVWYTVNSLAMLVVFTLVRPVLLVYFAFRLYVCTDDISGHPLGHIALLWAAISAGSFLNFYWWYKIVSGALALVMGGKKQSKQIDSTEVKKSASTIRKQQ